MKICNKEIFAQVEQLEYITIEEEKFQIKFILASDMKYLQICKGLKASTANFPCNLKIIISY